MGAVAVVRAVDQYCTPRTSWTSSPLSKKPTSDYCLYIHRSQTPQMASNTNTAIAFDLYGTLLSTESIAKELASHFSNEKAQSIAALWRRLFSSYLEASRQTDHYRYQLEYTWRLNSMCKF